MILLKIKIMEQSKTLKALSGSNFTSIADIVYSEYISLEDYKKKDHSNSLVLYKDKEFLLYKINDFELFENAVIFCNHLTLSSLFRELNKCDQFRNIKLITHQTDIPITKKYFLKKPKCVSEWYSTNVDYLNKKLIPIPLGLGNSFQTNQINSNNDFSYPDFSKNTSEAKVYLNFKISTNKKERENLYEHFSSMDWAELDQPDLDKQSYVNKLKNTSFVLAPWGNGYDTHRLWESLYFGKIPITKYHETYSLLKNLPICFVDNYKELNQELLNSFLNKVLTDKYNVEILDLKFWEKKIKSSSISGLETLNVSESKLNLLFFKIKFHIFRVSKSKFKIAKFYILKVIKFTKILFQKVK